MQRSVALRGRARFAALLQRWEQKAGQRGERLRLDRRTRRTRRTWRQMILGVVLQRSTRLLALGQVIAPPRRAGRVKAAAQGLAYFLRDAQAPVAALSRGLLEEALRQVDPAHLVTYQGKVLVVLDPTEYAKRSRGRGKCGRPMQHIGRVRAPQAAPTAKKAQRTTPPAPPQEGGQRAPREKRGATTYGYVDIGAGLGLRGKQFLPLARQLFSSPHPAGTSQTAVEEAVVGPAGQVLERVGLEAIVIGDRGVGRKEFIIRLAKRNQDAILRVDADITVYPGDAPDGLLLADALAQQPWRGEVTWDRGEQGRLRCRLRPRRATIRFNRSGRKADAQEATVTFVEAVPLDGQSEPLVLATTLPGETVAQARAIVRLYAQRWAIETAIERLLWVVAVAYALVVLALHTPRLQRFRAQATVLLKQLSVVGDRLTAGKLAEAIGLDYVRHAWAWRSVWSP